MLEKTSWSTRAGSLRSSDKRSANSDGASDPAPVADGKTSVSVANFPAPTSVSSKRCSTRGTPLGGAVSDTTSPDPQMIILKGVVTTALLSLVVLGDGAPSHNGLFVSPCGMRQDPPWPTRAFEALVVDEPVDALQDRLQVFRKSEVKVELLFLGMDFEDHREHLDHPDCLRFVPEGGGITSFRDR